MIEQPEAGRDERQARSMACRDAPGEDQSEQESDDAKGRKNDARHIRRAPALHRPCQYPSAGSVVPELCP